MDFGIRDSVTNIRLIDGFGRESEPESFTNGYTAFDSDIGDELGTLGGVEDQPDYLSAETFDDLLEMLFNSDEDIYSLIEESAEEGSLSLRNTARRILEDEDHPAFEWFDNLATEIIEIGEHEQLNYADSEWFGGLTDGQAVKYSEAIIPNNQKLLLEVKKTSNQELLSGLDNGELSAVEILEKQDELEKLKPSGYFTDKAHFRFNLVKKIKSLLETGRKARIEEISYEDLAYINVSRDVKELINYYTKHFHKIAALRGDQTEINSENAAQIIRNALLGTRTEILVEGLRFKVSDQANLFKADFSGIPFQDLQSKQSNLIGAKFDGSDCRHLSLEGSNLTSSDLRISSGTIDLNRATIMNADLRFEKDLSVSNPTDNPETLPSDEYDRFYQARLIPSDGSDSIFLTLDGARTFGAKFQPEILEQIKENYPEIRFDDSSNIYCFDFTGRNLDGLDLSKLKLNKSNFTDTCAIGTDFTGSSLDEARVTRMKINGEEGTKITAKQIDSTYDGNEYKGSPNFMMRGGVSLGDAYELNKAVFQFGISQAAVSRINPRGIR